MPYMNFFLTILSIYLDHTYIHGVQHVPIKNLYLYSYVYITHIYTFVFVRETLIGRFM